MGGGKLKPIENASYINIKTTIKNTSLSRQWMTMTLRVLPLAGVVLRPSLRLTRRPFSGLPGCTRWGTVKVDSGPRLTTAFRMKKGKWSLIRYRRPAPCGRARFDPGLAIPRQELLFDWNEWGRGEKNGFRRASGSRSGKGDYLPFRNSTPMQCPIVRPIKF